MENTENVVEAEATEPQKEEVVETAAEEIAE